MFLKARSGCSLSFSHASAGARCRVDSRTQICLNRRRTGIYCIKQHDDLDSIATPTHQVQAICKFCTTINSVKIKDVNVEL